MTPCFAYHPRVPCPQHLPFCDELSSCLNSSLILEGFFLPSWEITTNSVPSHACQNLNNKSSLPASKYPWTRRQSPTSSRENGALPQPKNSGSWGLGVLPTCLHIPPPFPACLGSALKEMIALGSSKSQGRERGSPEEPMWGED